MATLTLPPTVQSYFPAGIDPAQLWVHYSPETDTLTIYFNGKPVPTIWEDVDEYAYIGLDAQDETAVTGVMLEHFSKWLLLPTSA